MRKAPMDIIHSIQDNSFGIHEPEALKAKLVEYYAYNGVAPSVEIKGDFAHVHINEDLITRVNRHLDKALAMIKRGDYRKAITEYERVIHDYPMHSEAYRQLAQVKFMLKDFDGAINHLIDALNNDPRNYWALILMGNIYAKYKNDWDVAEKYYRTA
ncbi:MAG: tetratricopeptide repeat protein, partial [Schwartzia sp.]|nr:tetratricopeptide repeat protein [Schwartzia sp. (in: firmicutes)]